MKKFILLILLIGVNCNCGVPCSSTSSPPTGGKNSYTKTCSNICYDSNSKTLTAICNDANGNPKITSLITEASDTNINNCNGDLCNSQCVRNNQCPAIVPQQQLAALQQQQLAALQQQLAALQKQLAATPSSNYIKKIELNLQILQLNCQTNQSSCLSNLQTTFTTIQSLLPNPVPQNLQSFANSVNLLQTIYKSTSNQRGLNSDLKRLYRWFQQLTEVPIQKITPKGS